MTVSFADLDTLDAPGPSFTPQVVAPTRFAQSRDRQGHRSLKRDVTAAKDAFEEANPGLVASLRDLVSWNSFARSLTEQFDVRGFLSEAQVAAGRRMVLKQAEKGSERQENSRRHSGKIDVSAIEALFSRAAGNGLKRRRFVTDVLSISPAPDTGRNAGALYVKHCGEYAGKIHAGSFVAASGARDDTLPLLRDLAADPAGVARFYGKRTGNCCCCGRELTDAKSVEVGIGPICAEKWGL